MFRVAAILLISTLYISTVNCCFKKTDYLPTYPIKALAVIKGAVVNPVTNVSSPIVGVIQFTQNVFEGPVDVAINITGVVTGKQSKHGFHIHRLGISSPSDSPAAACGSTMDHYNPSNVTHGAPNVVVRHVGDLGNVDTDAEGRITTRLTDDSIQLFGQYSIIGRSVVLHEKEDDLGNGGNQASLTTGNAGPRIACGVVGLN